jgi:hypothetical protein
VARIPRGSPFWDGLKAIVFLGLLVVAFAYTIFTQTAHDFLWNSLRAGLVIFAIFSALSLSIFFFGPPPPGEQRKPPLRRPTLRSLRRILLSDVPGLTASFLFAGAGFYSLGVLLRDAFVGLSSRTGSVAISTFIVLLVGLVLFSIRLRYRAIYGLTEALAGLTIAANRFAATADQPGIRNSAFYLAVLTAGVYLVVRGLDNMHVGLTREPKDELAGHVISRVISGLSGGHAK